MAMRHDKGERAATTRSRSPLDTVCRTGMIYLRRWNEEHS